MRGGLRTYFWIRWSRQSISRPVEISHNRLPFQSRSGRSEWCRRLVLVCEADVHLRSIARPSGRWWWIQRGTAWVSGVNGVPHHCCLTASFEMSPLYSSPVGSAKVELLFSKLWSGPRLARVSELEQFPWIHWNVRPKCLRCRFRESSFCKTGRGRYCMSGAFLSETKCTRCLRTEPCRPTSPATIRCETPATGQLGC